MKLVPFGFVGAAAGGGPSLPDYLAAAIDGYSNGEGLPDWVTDGADSDSGNVTAWPSMKGTLADLVPTDAGASAAVISGEAFRCISAQADLRMPDATPGLPAAVLLTVRMKSTSYMRLVGRVGGGVTGVFLWPNSSDFYLEAQGASTSGKWTVAGGPLNTLAGRDQWHSIAFLMDPSGAVKPRLFFNGYEVPANGGPYTYTPPATQYDGIGHTDIFDDFYVGEVMYYDDPTAADLEAYTAAAKERWDPQLAEDETLFADIAAIVSHSHRAFMVDDFTDPVTTGVDADDGNVTSWQSSDSGDAPSRSTVGAYPMLAGPPFRAFDCRGRLTLDASDTPDDLHFALIFAFKRGTNSWPRAFRAGTNIISVNTSNGRLYVESGAVGGGNLYFSTSPTPGSDWHVFGLRFRPQSAGIEAWQNGVKLSPVGFPDQLSAKLSEVGNANFAEGYMGDWMVLGNLSDASMVSATTRLAERWGVLP